MSTRREGVALAAAVAALAAGCGTPDGRGARDLGEPRSATTAPPPEDAVVLFDGTSLAAWAARDGSPCTWTVRGDGAVVVGEGDAVTRREFESFDLHLEFLCPDMRERTGQARANSGVYVHGRYEIQVLDSWGDAPALNGCGAVYGVAAPRVNASLPPGEWQSYDVTFRAPVFEDGAVASRARLTVWHNGVLIHDDIELPTTTPGGLGRSPVPAGPLLLQDHEDPVRYRNIWIRPRS